MFLQSYKALYSFLGKSVREIGKCLLSECEKQWRKLTRKRCLVKASFRIVLIRKRSRIELGIILRPARQVMGGEIDHPSSIHA